MRYRIRVTRVQTAERVIRAADEEAAVTKIQAELDKPYGFLGNWTNGGYDIEVVGEEPSVSGTPTAPDGGPLLLSVKDAAEHLGISRGLLYELVNTGEIESLQLGRRRLISRDALTRFIEVNSSAGRRS